VCGCRLLHGVSAGIHHKMTSACASTLTSADISAHARITELGERLRCDSDRAPFTVGMVEIGKRAPSHFGGANAS
jgi:hypothetical protein